MFNCLTDAAFPKKRVEKIQIKVYDAIVRKNLTAMAPIVTKSLLFDDLKIMICQ